MDDSTLPPVNSSPITSGPAPAKESHSPAANNPVDKIGTEALQQKSKAENQKIQGLVKQVASKYNKLIDRVTEAIVSRLGITQKMGRTTKATSPLLRRELENGRTWKSESKQISIGNDTIEMMSCKSTNPLPSGQKKTIMICSGSGLSFEYYTLPKVRELTRLGHDVVLFNYRGFGNSTGKTSPSNILEDAEAVYSELTKGSNEARKDTVVLGYSLGGAPAAHLAEKHEIPVILERSFSSASDVASRSVPKKLQKIAKKIFDRGGKLDVESQIPKLKNKVLFIAASNDFTMPKEVRDRINSANSHLNNYTAHLVNGGHIDSPFDIRGGGDLDEFKKQMSASDEPISFEDLNPASDFANAVYNGSDIKALADWLAKL
jgi:pimeloyl-ACP methyl ester carboxylesterase